MSQQHPPSQVRLRPHPHSTLHCQQAALTVLHSTCQYSELHVTGPSMLRRVLACQQAAVLLQDIVGSALHKRVVLEAARKSESPCSLSCLPPGALAL